MKKEVLFISRGESFMVNAIIDNLKSGGYKVSRIDPVIKELNENKSDHKIIVFYLGDYVEEISDFLTFLKDVCIEEFKYLYCIGSKEELSVIRSNVLIYAVRESYERPVNVKTLIADLDALIEQHEGDSAKKTILVVDDDVVFLNMMKEWLSDKYMVSLVNSGTRAITFLANNKPDLILLDYEMPVTSGPQVLEMIRSDSELENTPVIFLTGKGDRESVTKVLSLKPNGYLLKSLKQPELLASLDEFFEKQKVDKIIKIARNFS
ncbi:MAG: response regulator [Lachnospiraceae bacterium]|nr:response regulator [Lachnospiraceae bacterium]